MDFSMNKKPQKGQDTAKDDRYIGKAWYRPFLIQAIPAVGVAAIYFMERSGMKDDRMVLPHGHLIILCGLFLVVLCLNCWDTSVWYYYGVSDEGLNEYRFFKHYVRTIPWSQIIQAGVQKDRVRDHGLIVTLTYGPKWDVGKKKGSKAYWRKYRPCVLYIWYYRKALPVFEQYYGKLDY